MKPISVAALSAVLVLSSTAASAQEAVMPSWMAGCWQMRDGERWAEECWTIPRGGQMMGSGRTGEGATLAGFEFMLIERGEDGLRFRAAPGGAGWTPFAAGEDPGEGVTFLNPDNDYPQRVRYWREGDLLKAEISQLDGSRTVGFSFSRMGG